MQLPILKEGYANYRSFLLWQQGKKNICSLLFRKVYSTKGLGKSTISILFLTSQIVQTVFSQRLAWRLIKPLIQQDICNIVYRFIKLGEHLSERLFILQLQAIGKSFISVIVMFFSLTYTAFALQKHVGTTCCKTTPVIIRPLDRQR